MMYKGNLQKKWKQLRTNWKLNLKGWKLASKLHIFTLESIKKGVGTRGDNGKGKPHDQNSRNVKECKLHWMPRWDWGWKQMANKIEKIFNYNVVSPYIHWIWPEQQLKFGGILGWRVEQTFNIVGNPIRMWKAQRFKTQSNFNGGSWG